MTSDAQQDPVDGPEDPAGAARTSPEGVDLTLIRLMLRMTPAERLESLRVEVASLNTLVRRDALRAR